MRTSVQDGSRYGSGTRRADNGSLFGSRIGNPGSRHFQTMINQHHANWTGLACLLAISCALFLQNLSTPYITLWDEAVHVNVIKNLAEHCCLPQLHRSANIGTDYRRWTNNSLWLHKPLLPFYVAAGIYKLLGGSLWALSGLGLAASMSVHSSFQNCYACSRSISLFTVIAP